MHRFGILGAGHFAARHVEALGQLRDRARLALVARRVIDRQFPEAETLGARQVTPDALVESPEIDAVCICTPNHLHRVQAEAALRAGKHVFCEKPLALTIEDADAVIDAARQMRRILMVGHITRYTPMYVAAAEVLSSGQLGTPKAAYASRLHTGADRLWRMDPALGGGVAFDLQIHDLDLLNWYIGRPQTVIARGCRNAHGGYDHLSAILTYAQGPVATAEGSFFLHEPARLRAFLRVVCEHGHIEVDNARPEARVRVFPEGAPEEVVPLDAIPNGATAVAGELAEFMDAIEGNPPRRLRLEDARFAVECAGLIVRAADSRQEIRLA